MNSRAALCLGALLALAAAPLRAADEVAVVLSAPGGAYLEAFSAFQAAYGSEVPYFDASAAKPSLPEGVTTVVTLGNRAATLDYPAGVNLINAMAPGFFSRPRPGGGRVVKISMVPEFRLLLAKLRQIQPSLARLAIFWSAPGFAPFVVPMQEAGTAAGIKVVAFKVTDPATVPSLLRKTLGETDAFWLPPDPLLISPETLLIFTEFSLGNGVPMYTTTKGMVRDGACASVGISFAESGAAAGMAAKALRAGEQIPDIVFPPKLEITLNASSARRCGLRFSQEVLREAVYLFP